MRMRHGGKEFQTKNENFTIHLMQRRPEEYHLTMTEERPVLLVILALLVRTIVDVMIVLIVS